jgi:hypothetical protein
MSVLFSLLAQPFRLLDQLYQPTWPLWWVRDLLPQPLHLLTLLTQLVAQLRDHLQLPGNRSQPGSQIVQRMRYLVPVVPQKLQIEVVQPK